MKNQIAFFLILLTLCGCTNMSSIKNKYFNVSYANDSKAQKMDLFVPEGAGPFPTIVLIHGGGFQSGDKKAEYALAKQLVTSGYAAVCVNYRLSGEAIFPAAVHDIKAAIRFIKGNAKKYSIDPHRIGSWGASAGGHLSAMIGTSAGDDFLDGRVGHYLEETTNVQVCIDWFGPIDFSKMVNQARKLGLRDGFDVTMESKYLGADATNLKNQDLVQRSNPTSYIDPNDPPFYIQVGGMDPLIPYLQSQHFANALRIILGDKNVVFELIENGKHGGAKFSNHENITKIIGFLDKHLKK